MQKPAYGAWQHVERILGELCQADELLHDAVGLEYCLHIQPVVGTGGGASCEAGAHALDHLVKPCEQGGGVGSLPLAGPFRLIAQHGSIGMTAHCLQEGIAERALLHVVAVGLQAGQSHEQTIYRCVSQRKSHGHVHLSHRWGKRMEHGVQERFVAQDHRVAVGHHVLWLAEPLLCEACRSVVGGAGDERYIVQVSHVVILLLAQCTGEVEQVLPHEDACFIVLVIHVEGVVVPIEEALPAAFDFHHEGLLHVIEHIEPYKGNSLAFLEIPVEQVGPVFQVACHTAVERTGVECSSCLQSAAECLVERVHVAPDMQEALFDGRVAFHREVAEEALQSLLLLIRQIVDVVQAMLVIHVGKHQLGICHVLVYVIEVR